MISLPGVLVYGIIIAKNDGVYKRKIDGLPTDSA